MHLTEKYIKGSGDYLQESRAQVFTVNAFHKGIGAKLNLALGLEQKKNTREEFRYL